MASDLPQEKPPVTQQQIETAAADVRRLEPEFQAARRKAQEDKHKVLAFRGTIALYRFLLKFRGVGRAYELWPVAVMIVGPFTVGALLLAAAVTFNFGFLSSTLSILLGVLVAGAVCGHLLWRPPTADIQRSLPGEQADLAGAEMVSQQSTVRLRTLETPYLLAKEMHRNLTNELARYEEQQKQRQLERHQEQCQRDKQRVSERKERQRQQVGAQRPRELSVPCPFCGEPIQPVAKKCKHCRELLDPVLRAAEERKHAAEERKRAAVAAPETRTVFVDRVVYPALVYVTDKPESGGCGCGCLVLLIIGVVVLLITASK